MSVDSDESSCSSSSDEEMDEEIEKSWIKEMMRKRSHPERLHEELWFNEPGEVSPYGPRGKVASLTEDMLHQVKTSCPTTRHA